MCHCMNVLYPIYIAYKLVIYIYTTYKHVVYFTIHIQGGLHRLFQGGLWRSINIIGTVYIANECILRLPKILYPGQFSDSDKSA